MGILKNATMGGAPAYAAIGIATTDGIVRGRRRGECEGTMFPGQCNLTMRTASSGHRRSLHVSQLHSAWYAFRLDLFTHVHHVHVPLYS
jgi:G:T/U-mismatch repair DNA glycosylase